MRRQATERVTDQVPHRVVLAAVLARAGCVAAYEEADELLATAAGDAGSLALMVERRLSGEPLAWVTGWALFTNRRLRVFPGVYVPRWQSEPLARRAAQLLPPRGRAVDMCTGSGALAMSLQAARPRARVLATEVDALACRCARANGVEVYQGDLGAPLPAEVYGRADLVTAIVPYVPTERAAYLPRDVRDHEPRLAWDGGPGGTRVLVRAVAAAATLLAPGGSLLLELGDEQDRLIGPVLAENGFGRLRRLVDEEGDLRGLEARKRSGTGTRAGMS